MKCRLTVALIAVSLCACAAQLQPIEWARVGPPAAGHQLDVDLTSCRGSAQAQASGIAPLDKSGKRQGLGLSAGVNEMAHSKKVNDTYNAVLFGCMADRGWLASNR